MSARRVLTMFSLVLAGEAVFMLPFHVARFFRPTVLEAFDFSVTQVGVLNSIYGFVAMAAYVLGGPLADRFAARKLMAFALLATGLGGFYMASFPGFAGMSVLFGIWGVTTILPFWAALIRATRDSGGHDDQGRTFGWLDGGRGLLAAGVALIAWLLFRSLLPDNQADITDSQRITALRMVVYLYTFTSLGAAAWVWFLVPESRLDKRWTTGSARGLRLSERVGNALPPIMRVLKMPKVWLQALVIVCAYCAYKGIDNYSLYARDAFGLSELDAPGVAVWSTWIRPVAAIAAGFFADRISSSRAIIGCFALLALTYISFATSATTTATVWLLWTNVLVSCVPIFALRGIYFALLEESAIPSEMTGTAVGVISFIGFTPEVFFPPLAGRLIDRSPGAAGHQHVFWLLVGIAILGMLTTAVLRRLRPSSRAAG